MKFIINEDVINLSTLHQFSCGSFIYDCVDGNVFLTFI